MLCRPLDVVQMALCPALNGLRHQVEHIARYVELAALFVRPAKDLAQCVSALEHRLQWQEQSTCKPVLLQIQQPPLNRPGSVGDL